MVNKRCSLMNDCLGCKCMLVKYSCAHEHIAYPNVIHKTAHDEGNGYISSDTEKGHPSRN